MLFSSRTSSCLTISNEAFPELHRSLPSLMIFSVSEFISFISSAIFLTAPRSLSLSSFDLSPTLMIAFPTLSEIDTVTSIVFPVIDFSALNNPPLWLHLMSLPVRGRDSFPIFSMALKVLLSPGFNVTFAGSSMTSAFLKSFAISIAF